MPRELNGIAIAPSRAQPWLLGGVLLWEVTLRSQMGFAISFLEEIWSRNLGHVFVSPVRPRELIAALVGMSMLRMIAGVIPAVILAFFALGAARKVREFVVDQRAVALVREAGYLAATTTRRGRVRAEDDMFQLHRIPVVRSTSWPQFLVKLLSPHENRYRDQAEAVHG